MKKNLLISLLVFTLSVFPCGCSYSEPREIDHFDGNPIISEENIPTNDDEDKEIYVSVMGEVLSPGVYIIPAESRVYELINMAGGTTKAADLTRINMVDLLADGTQLFIPTKIDTGDIEIASSASTTHDGKININTATADELITIPGIGSSRAQAIISYREKSGLFKTVSDIMNVPGIKEKTFENIRELICVN